MFRLNDLPPELFSNVIHELVSDIGINEAWRLRETSRLFAAEIDNNVVSKQRLDINNKENTLNIAIGKAAKYLFYQVIRKQPDPHTRPALPLLVRRLASYLQEELGVPAKEEYKTIRDLCQGLVNTLGSTQIYWLIQKEQPLTMQKHPFLEPPKELSGNQKLFASISIRSHTLTEKLLAEINTTHEFELPIPPLEVALGSNDEKLYGILLSRIESYTGTEKQQSISQLGVDAAIIHSIKIGNLTHTKQLVQLRESVEPRVAAEASRFWLVTAIETRQLTVAQRFVNMFPELSQRNLTHLTVVTRTCQTGSTDMMNLLINEGSLDLSKGNVRTLPLACAVRNGSPAIIEAIIDAGADVNKRLEGRNKKSGPQTVSELAVRPKDLGILDCLLGRGANLPRKRFWPTTKRSYQRFREAVSKHDAFSGQVPEWEDFMAEEK
ncbi:hypothetical protein IAQ61_011559 [Plenodomus lingam]|uniref:Uncharacterized protein n=1 Tax=Leptosphaeria maculans (strain JN3 / isolate v23.1.3 / race Av1-4-5-6-7-8) TaxID=985895 RepID=E5AAF5_LEPMJ|nr:hypothetical protein LEMA_P017760.1 [Plenodomus lingam JN3]KAH9859778.1 hypothetical protein IAQ61_011559 [Plenodomus lingam]CBY00646.1 hypothetical protein LEMA_P017760.1 [Plenodomus lingam JN3]